VNKNTRRSTVRRVSAFIPFALLAMAASPLAADAATIPTPLPADTVGATGYSASAATGLTSVTVGSGASAQTENFSTLSQMTPLGDVYGPNHAVVGYVYGATGEPATQVNEVGTLQSGVTYNVYEADGMLYDPSFGTVSGIATAPDTLTWNGASGPSATLTVNPAPAFTTGMTTAYLQSGSPQSLDSYVTGGTGPLSWSVSAVTMGSATSSIDMSQPIGTVYSGANSAASGQSVIGNVYGPAGTPASVMYNVYADTTPTPGGSFSVYYLGQGVYLDQAGGLWNTGALGYGTLSFEPMATDANGVAATGTLNVTVQGQPAYIPPPVTTSPSSSGTGTTGTITGTPTSPVSPVGNGTTTYQSTVNSSAYTLVLASNGIDATGGTVSAVSGATTVAVTVPQGAFQSDETVTVNAAPLSTVQAGVPSGQTAVAAFGVNFSGAAPTSPIQVQIQNSSIPTSALVYKVLANGQWQPVPATVKNGVLTVSFTTDPDFVIVDPNLAAGQRQILWNGQQEQVAHGIVAKAMVHKNMTTYMPIWYAMQVLKQEGLTSTWNGKVWNISTAGSAFTPNLSNLSVGTGADQIEINGQVVQNTYGMVAKDPAHGNMTTYMPIYWLFQALTHLGVQSSWNGMSWGMTYDASTLPAVASSGNGSTTSSN